MNRRIKQAVRNLIGIAEPYIPGTITHVSTEEPVAALTFDDGPHPVHTLRLLELLSAYGARATFFMVGETAERHPHVVKQVAAAGHEIGNHSWDHSAFPLLSGRQQRKQLRDCTRVLAPYGGDKLFRPPYGWDNITTRLDTYLLGYEVVTWNIAAQDWLDHDGPTMARTVMEKFVPGSIILFHDTLHTFKDERYRNREPMLEAVSIILQQLGSAIRFVTVSELLRSGHPQRTGRYRPVRAEMLAQLKGA